MSARRAVLLDTGASGPRAREGSALAASLTARGFSFERHSDPQALLDSLGALPTDVLIIDADSPSLDMREFVEKLRQDPLTARTLIVALASGDPREIPARRELALTLAKPINADDAASRLEALVVTRQRAATNLRELRGDLSQLPIPDLLQLLAASRASGTLTVDSSGRRGTLVLDNGDLRNVACGPASGVKAFVRLLTLAEGAFVFNHGAIDTATTAGEVLSLGPALFEATRQLDEIARLRSSLPELWVELRRSVQPMSDAIRAKIAASGVYAEMARLLDSPRTLGALLDSSPFTDAELLEALEAFRRDGLVAFAGGQASDRVHVLDGPYASALVAHLAETGRALTRVMVLTASAPPSTESQILRALGGIAGFVSAESALSGELPLGTLGTLLVGDTRVELFAVPVEPDLYPLWSVFGAGADAAILTTPLHDGGRDERIVAGEIGIPVATVTGALTAQTVADALRGALEQLNSRR